MSEQPEATLVQSRRSKNTGVAAPANAMASPSERAGINVEVDAGVGIGISIGIETGIGAEVGVGTVLKQRFELIQRLGAGGMGTVYKARDLRQVEAGDQHPWVALKIINAGLARHERALMALQQEAKKTQRLAHPNIVSVHDFDRADSVAFMTMELLEGESLDRWLRRHPAGLEPEQAFDLIRQIARAIAHAHQHGIVHADLKPANIFLTREGRIKVLDFGIARAMQDDESFDAHDLKALTPAYASVHMLAGGKPRPADDLYALGCLFYLLLTGRHPLNRRRATEAQAAGMKPQPITSLSPVRWRALARLLQFRPRGDLSLQPFLTDFFDERRQVRWRAAAILAALTLMVALTGVGTHAYQQYRLHQLAESILQPDAKSVQPALQDIGQLPSADRVLVLERARDRVADRIEQQLQTLQNADDFQHLDAYLQPMRTLYPDSSRLQDASDRFERQRQTLLSELTGQLEQRMSQRDFTSPPSFAGQVMALQTVAPDHALLTHRNLKSLMAREASVAVYLGERWRAQMILAQAEQLFPADRVRFDRIRQRLARQAATAEVSPLMAINHDAVNALEQARSLLQQFDLTAPGDGLLRYLTALSEHNADLYAVLRQGLQDFVAVQQKASHSAEQFRHWKPLQQQLAQLPVLAVNQTSRTARRVDTCPVRLANLGKQRGSRCRDNLGNAGSGPELVVVKVEGQAPFAITRTEVSAGTLTDYCQQTRRCSAEQQATLPAVNLSLEQIQQYASWLSDRSGFTYRLPLLEEWLAVARDDSGVMDHNCRAISSGRQLRGQQLRPVEDGFANSLGLVNLFGNAEEWVQQGSGFVGVGGSYQTDMMQCNAAYQNSGDGVRGFRLVRELSR